MDDQFAPESDLTEEELSMDPVTEGTAQVVPAPAVQGSAPVEARAFAAGQAARAALGGAVSGVGNMIQTIMTKEGPVEVETAPAHDAAASGAEDLSDLFLGPQEDDDDIYSEDLVAPPGEEELGLDPEDVTGGDMEDLFGLEEPLEAPPGRRIVRVIKRPSRRNIPPAGMGGMR